MQKKHFILSMLLLLLGVLIPVQAQEGNLLEYLIKVQGKYGSDADLVNGEKYFYPYSRAEGDPFFYPGQRRALLRIKERAFPEQKIRFDIYNQQLVLEFPDLNGSANYLVLRIEWVESVDFGTELIKKMKGPEGEDVYLQVIYEGQLSCYYQWNKLYQLNLSSGKQSYYFTERERTSYLLKEGAFISYRNNRSFLKAFAKEQSKEIKQHLRTHRLKVRRVSDAQMAEFMKFCDSITNEAN